MKKKNLCIALFALLLAGGAYGTTLAFFTDAKEQKNIFTMGEVSISLAEPKFEEITNGTYEIKNVVPNQKVDKDPQITVGGNSLDAYLRASITYEGLSEEESKQLETNIAFNSGWIKSDDGYYYYNQKTSKHDVVHIFDSLVIPSQWSNEVAARQFKVIVNAEAIQANYFTPHTEEVNGVLYITNWSNQNGTPVVAQ